MATFVVVRLNNSSAIGGLASDLFGVDRLWLSWLYLQLIPVDGTELAHM
jgi:hypothetical protein